MGLALQDLGWCPDRGACPLAAPLHRLSMRFSCPWGLPGLGSELESRASCWAQDEPRERSGVRVTWEPRPGAAVPNPEPRPSLEGASEEKSHVTTLSQKETLRASAQPEYRGDRGLAAWRSRG